jgi:L-malate glycosyltransferase
MNILVLVAFYPDAKVKYSGVFFKDQVEALSSEHYTVLVYPYVNQAKFSILPEYSINEAIVHNNLKEIRIEISRTIPVYNQINYFMVTFKLIRHLAKRDKIDIIHGHFAYPISFLCYLLSKSLKIPYCITEHSSDFNKGFRTKIHRFLGLLGLKSANGIFSSGELLAKYLGQLLKKEVKVLHNTINLDKYNLDVKSDIMPFSIGFLGILNDNRKGLDLLMEALSEIKLFDYVLHIGGEGKRLEDFKTLAVNFGIDDKCIFHGSVDPKDVPSFMAKCNAFILPSRAESFGVVVIEAMAAGLPVIATRCGGPEYLITEETGFVVEKENIRELRNAITKLFEHFKDFNPSLIKQHAKQWDYPSFVEKATGYYEQIIETYNKDIKSRN